MSNLIEARGLTKDFGDFRAVNEVSFTVEKGEIFGLLGPNGAGKTTTLRMLSGLLSPTAGEASINGFSMQQEQMKARRSLGFLTGDMDLYRRLNPRELLLYFGKLYETPKAELEERVERLIEAFGITPFVDRHCEKLSTGQKQRVSIARALLKDPRIYLFDDCLSAVDTETEEEILNNLKQLSKQKTHYW